MIRDLAGLVLCLLATTAPAADPPSDLIPWADWPVKNAPAAAPRTETVTPHVVWRLDCGEDAELLVGRLVAAAPGLDGRVLLVDRQQAHVLVIDPDGKVERIVGSRGEGPGEVTGMHRALQLPDGRIETADGCLAPAMTFGTHGRIVYRDTVDDPAGAWDVLGDPLLVPMAMVRDLRHAGGPVLVASFHVEVSPPLGTGIRELCLLDVPAGDRTVIARRVFQFDFADRNQHERDNCALWSGGLSDVDANGRVAMATDRGRWLIAVREPDGTGTMVARPLAPGKRSAETRAAVAGDYGDAEYTTVFDHEPVIKRIRWRPDGRLWVEPFAVAPEPGAFACFDELEVDGTLRRRIQLVVSGDPEVDELVLLEDGRFVLLRGFSSAAGAESDEPVTEAVLLAL